MTASCDTHEINSIRASDTPSGPWSQKQMTCHLTALHPLGVGKLAARSKVCKNEPIAEVQKTTAHQGKQTWVNCATRKECKHYFQATSPRSQKALLSFFPVKAKKNMKKKALLSRTSVPTAALAGDLTSLG